MNQDEIESLLDRIEVYVEHDDVAWKREEVAAILRAVFPEAFEESATDARKLKRDQPDNGEHDEFIACSLISKRFGESDFDGAKTILITFCDSRLAQVRASSAEAGLREALELCLLHVPKEAWRFVESKAIVTVSKGESEEWDRVEPLARTKARAALGQSEDTTPR